MSRARSRQPDAPSAAELETRLGHRFSNPRLLETALTHGSAGETDASVASYERLEFLGDSVLGLTIAELLFRRDSDAREGEMSRLKASLVSTASLAECARALGIEPWVKRGRGYAASLSHAVLADVVEALTAAIYLDGGLQAAQDFVRRILGDRLEQARESTEVDAKTRLQEIYQGILRETPTYSLADAAGPDHARVFVAEVHVKGRPPVQGRGMSRKAAEQAAAAAAIEAWALDTVAKGDKSR
jgi:ribonuclease-3